MSDTAQRRQGSFFQRYLLPGFAMKGVIIGGGYATGRELAEYFLSQGPVGALMAMALAMLLWSLVAALTFALARQFAAYDYRSFMERLLGRGWVLFEIGYLLFAVLLLAVFGAAAGEVAKSLFPVPAIAGTLALALATWLVASRGGWAVEAMFKYVSVLLYSVYALFLILAVTRFGDRIGAGLERGGADAGWVIGGLTYGSYNLVAAVMILPMLRHIATRHEAFVAGVIAGPLAMLPGFFFLLAMIAFHPEILAQTLPSDFLLREIGMPAFRILFQLMVFGALLESCVGVVHAVNERALAAWKARRAAPPPALFRPLLTVALLALCMFIADRIGLVALIASGYRLMALFFLIVFVLPVLTVGVARLWRREAAVLQEGPQHG